MIVIATITLAVNVRECNWHKGEDTTDESFYPVQEFLEHVAVGLPASCAELREVSDACHVSTLVTPITGSYWPDFKHQNAEERRFFKIDNSMAHKPDAVLWSKPGSLVPSPVQTEDAEEQE